MKPRASLLQQQAACTALLLLHIVALRAAARLLAQHPAQAAPQPAFQAWPNAPLQNLVLEEPLAVYRKWQGVLNDTQDVYAIREDLSIRISGANFVPFTVAHQQVLTQAFREIVLPKQGPVQLTSYREGYPDPAAPKRFRGGEDQPYVDLAGTVYHVLNASLVTNLGANTTWQQAWQAEFANFLAWVGRVMKLGNWSSPAQSIRLLQMNVNGGLLVEAVRLHPIIVLQAVVAVRPSEPQEGVLLPAEQASEVAAIVGEALLRGLGTLVEVHSRNTTAIQATLGPATSSRFEGRQLVSLEATLFTCRANASRPTPECETEVLEHILGWLVGPGADQARWQRAGLESIEVVRVQQRPSPQPPPPPPAPTSHPLANGSQPRPWLPSHLDRIDQRELPLDGQFSANASGTGVNVYLLSSGVLASHEEFNYSDGRPGTRVKASWGYEGLDPLQDCNDAYAWYGFGTYAASLIAGLSLGVAKNATIYSVRFREMCVFENPAIWSPGGLPSAIDSVLSTFVPPALMVIDTWWSPARLNYDNDAYIATAISDRLDKCRAANITVISAAGLGLPSTPPCENIIANHPGVISVGSSDAFDQKTVYGPGNSTCINLFAPGGGLAGGVTGAHPTGPADYTTIIPRAFGASWVAAGVAAQFLSLHPTASPDQVRQALVGWATPHTVTGAGQNTTTRLLFTNFTEPPRPLAAVAGAAAASGGGGGGGVGAGVVAAIVVPITAALALAVALVARRRRRAARAAPPHIPALALSEWEIPESDVEICKRPDGSAWLLGEGSYGKVYKATKGGVQEVAVKVMHRMEEPLQEQFVQEIALMKFVSRDANITQFYGACVQADNMMLVVEYMQGGDLRTALTADRTGALSWYQAGKAIALDIVRGLHFLHAHHVIHRDIKSKNILLTRDTRAKIADVGLAHILEGPGQQCQQDGFMGTWAWAGPELLLGEECTVKVDMYSMGVVLWEIATQEIPLRGCLRDPEVPRECPQQVADAIDRCLKRDPSLRPTARELYDILVAAPPTDDSYAAPASLGDSTASTSAPGTTPAASTTHSAQSVGLGTPRASSRRGAATPGSRGGGGGGSPSPTGPDTPPNRPPELALVPLSPARGDKASSSAGLDKASSGSVHGGGFAPPEPGPPQPFALPAAGPPPAGSPWAAGTPGVAVVGPAAGGGATTGPPHPRAWSHSLSGWSGSLSSRLGSVARAVNPALHAVVSQVRQRLQQVQQARLGGRRNTGDRR